MTDEELMNGNLAIMKYMGFEGVNPYCIADLEFIGKKYYDSWDLLHEVIDKINGLGKQYNLSIFKTYVALSVEKESKFFKDFHFAHSEYITENQTGKEAAFKLIVKFIEWELSSIKTNP